MNGPTLRASSPRPGASTLMTRAPRSASTIVQYGPASTRVRSTTVMPVSGPDAGMRYVRPMEMAPMAAAQGMSWRRERSEFMREA